MTVLRCGATLLELSRPRVMGIVNITPDSFSDGGRFLSADRAIAHARRLVEEGADLLDLGGESSRPGAERLPLDEELARLLPVLRGLHDLHDAGVPLSVDTYKPEVMRAALGEGASMINDIWALRQPGALEAVAGSDCALCLMHMQRDPQTMQQAPQYGDVVTEVLRFLQERLEALDAAGIGRDRVVLDPGFGFGKTLEQNFDLLGHVDAFAALGQPLLAGISRKSMLGMLTGRPVDQRLGASVAGALAAVQRGARIVRVHDVAATVDALKVFEMVQSAAIGENRAIVNHGKS